MPGSRITRAYFAVSDLMNALNSFGPLPTGSASCMSFERVPLTTSAESLSSTDGGTPAGATKPYHAIDS